MDAIRPNMTGAPPGQRTAEGNARRATAYHGLAPYPRFGFRDWRTEERGPHPKCQPFVLALLNRAVRWLWAAGQGATFETDDDATSDSVKNIWRTQRLRQQVRTATLAAGQSGTMGAKFGLAKDGSPVVRFFDGCRAARVWKDDEGEVLMARVQYPRWNGAAWEWWREDWTPDTLTTYEPLVLAGSSTGEEPPYEQSDLVDRTEFRAPKKSANPFRVVPVHLVQFEDSGATLGEGMLWRLFGAVDLVNLAYDIMAKDNQISVWPREVVIDGKLPDDAPEPTYAPGSVEEIESVKDNFQAKVQLLETTGRSREHLRQYAEDVMDQVYQAAGGVRFNPADVTNKGNLTVATLEQLYRPLIESTDDRRSSFGEAGLSEFFGDMATGMANAKVAGFAADSEFETVWPDYFDVIASDLRVKVDTLGAMVANGFTTLEYAVRETARMTGQDPEQMVEDTKANERDDDGGTGDGSDGGDAEGPGGTGGSDRAAPKAKGGAE